jgi:hypothetical protein
MQDVKGMWGPRGRFRQAVAKMSSSITDATATLLGPRSGPVLLFGLLSLPLSLARSLALSLALSLPLSLSLPLCLSVWDVHVCVYTSV